MNTPTVLLLTGGSSRRFWPLGDKHTLSFLGKPRIFYALSQIHRMGYRFIILVGSTMNVPLFSSFKKEFPDITLEILEQVHHGGMAGAVFSASKYISGKPILILSPSDLYDDSVFRDFASCLDSKPRVVLAGKTVDRYFRGGYLTVKDGYVVDICEKPSPASVPSSIVTFVFDYFSDADILLRAIDRVGLSEADDGFERAVQQCILDGVLCTFLPYEGYWGYMKYPWDVLQLTSHFLDQIQKSSVSSTHVDSSVRIQGNVIIERGVRILGHATVCGPAYIGEGSVIGNNVLIRESMIGKGCVVGFSTEIARSYVGDSCWFHTNYIGDSVVGNNVSMGAGCVLANFRLDEQTVSSRIQGERIDTGLAKFGAVVGEHASIGVHASIMPGVKIGRHSVIGPGVVLDRDVADAHQFFLDRRQYHVSPLSSLPRTGGSRRSFKSRLSTRIQET